MLTQFTGMGWFGWVMLQCIYCSNTYIVIIALQYFNRSKASSSNRCTIIKCYDNCCKNLSVNNKGLSVSAVKLPCTLNLLVLHYNRWSLTAWVKLAILILHLLTMQSDKIPSVWTWKWAWKLCNKEFLNSNTTKFNI